MGIMEKVIDFIWGYILNIFIRLKKDGGYRIILNFIFLNNDIEYINYKMDIFKLVINLVKKDCYFVLIDLKDVYYFVVV